MEASKLKTNPDKINVTTIGTKQQHNEVVNYFLLDCLAALHYH